MHRLGRMPFGHPDVLPDNYEQILNIGGIMARLEIPQIEADLPLLHGTQPEVLARGVGHLEGSSLPIGGYGTHAVFTAHSGMPHARFFSRLHELEIGDNFYVTTLGKRMVYQVDYIKVILPNETWHLNIQPGKDLVTLITCTPIHVNTHRLLVRGVRVQG